MLICHFRERTRGIALTGKIRTFNRKLFIFDLDGVITDTMGLWPGIIYDTAAHFGAYLEDGYFRQVQFLNLPQTLEWIRGRYPTDVSFEEMLQYFKEYSASVFLEKVALKPFIREAMRALKEAGAVVAIYSNSTEYIINEVANRFELNEILDLKFSSEQIGEKQNPASYDYVISAAGCTRSDAAVIDDALNVHETLKSKAPEILRIAVYDEAYASRAGLIREACDVYLESLKDFFE